MFSRSDVEALAAGELGDMVPISEAAKYLSLKPYRLINLIRQGRVQALTGPTVDGATRYTLAKATVLSLKGLGNDSPTPVEELRPIANTDAPPTIADRKMVSTEEAAELLGLSKKKFYLKIRVQETSLAPCRTGKTNFFWLDEVMALKRKQDEVQKLAATDELVSGLQAAAMLGLSVSSFYRWTKHTDRLLPVHGRFGVTGTRYRLTNVLACQEYFSATLTSPEVLNYLGVTYGTLVNWRKSGVLEPADGASTERRHTRYWKSDVERIRNTRKSLQRRKQ
ncbi:MAG TPA: helix-turn-helix domain-containing protein [Symbiobacteriaceae bacterium]|nr:helix-turn-helix domain-containing protein [Symbiobacteriaceae bacterium]